MIDIEITSREIGTNSTTVITDTENRILYESNGSGYDVFVAFSASSVCTVDLSIEDDFEDYGTYSVERLTNPNNTIPNLYTLHLTLDNYTYFPGDDEPSARDINFGIGVHTCNFGYGDSEFSISQSGCPMCHVTFNWGAYSTPGNNKNYTVDYYAGDRIDDADIRYGLDDLIPDGLGWDGKFYYDQEFTNEVIFDCDTVERDITIYANVFQALKFNVKDGKTEAYLGSINVTVNDSPTILAYCQDCQYKYVIPKPYEDATEEFTITVSKDGYISRTLTYSFNTLNEHTILLEEDRGRGFFYATFAWDQRVDFDPTIQIFDSNMSPLMEDEIEGFYTRQAQLYYGANNEFRCGDEDDPSAPYCLLFEEWKRASGYGDWLSGQGRTDLAYALIKRDGIFYEHDYDYTGQTDRDPVEHMSGEINLNSDRIYRFCLNTCNRNYGLADLNSSLTLTFNGQERTFLASENKDYWTICDIKKVNGEWIIDEIDEYSDVAQPGLVACPGATYEMMESIVTSWVNGGSISESSPRDLVYQNNSIGYEFEFSPSETGSYCFKGVMTEGAGVIFIRIFRKSDNREVYSTQQESGTIGSFTATESEEYKIKIISFSAGAWAGRIRVSIDKMPDEEDIFESIRSWSDGGDLVSGEPLILPFTGDTTGYEMQISPESGTYNVTFFVTKGFDCVFMAAFDENDRIVSDIAYNFGLGENGFSFEVDGSSSYKIKTAFWSPEAMEGRVFIVPKLEE